MNSKKRTKSLSRAVLVLIALTLAAAPSFAVELVAVGGNWTAPNNTVIPMWGFVEVPSAANFSCSTPANPWAVGPQIAAVAGAALTINLKNCLTESVSIIIPGQATAEAPVWVGDRVHSFTKETPAGATASYTWSSLKAGTYLYQSGTHPAKQVQMGLYGALKVDFAAAPAQAAYNGIPYAKEVVLLYSEIDEQLHNPPAAAKPLDYIPQYYLINGQPYKPGNPALIASNINESTLIRFLNAGLKSHVPTLLNAPYMSVIAEDGNLYPYAKEQYSMLLAAGKTMDAIWRPTAEGTYPLTDSANFLTNAGVTGGGMLTKLQVGGTPSGAPVAVNDSAIVPEGGTVTGNVLANDTGSSSPSALLVGNVSNGLLTLNANGTFSYSHNGGQTTTDSFTYKVKDTVSLLESNVAKVAITVTPVNDLPVATADSYSATSGVMLTVAAPGVLGNDSDPDGNPLTAVLSANAGGGSLTLNGNGSFTYTPNPGTISDSFTYFANDGTANSTTAATVTITVSAPVNTAPVAVDDSATTKKNQVVFINLIGNDTDAENNLKDSSGNVAASRISIVTQPTRGGTVAVLTNGVNFTPKNNFRGTDVFTYTVTDIGGLKSNTATVRVNVTN